MCVFVDKREENMTNSIVIIGASGKMGKIAEEALAASENFNIVGRVGRQDDLAAVLEETKPDVALELTDHASVLENSQTIIAHGVRPVIGASGLKQDDIKQLAKECKAQGIGGAVVPNFSIASAIANSMVGRLSQYFDDISIVEFHHAAKKDKPSGTARYVAEISGIPETEIASIRFDGYLAKQQVYISGVGERLVIDHESFNRDSFKKGILIACEKVMDFDELKLGLENVI
ncbi:MAG: hypothetical protein GC137_00205 [Alphaproteobacteria bacterium]|nr:hypothetical protein [Alphaproteobacteria bacterium]